MARTELAIKVRMGQLKKLIAMLKLGGVGTKAQTDKALKELRECEAELAGLKER